MRAAALPIISLSSALKNPVDNSSGWVMGASGAGVISQSSNR